tara:strand:- start:767 stop:1048 length:282 start_codon:yes stop_codon:yes gene_type:complete
MNIKEVWQVWRGTSTFNKDMEGAFKKVCTTTACHGILLELESVIQKNAELEHEIQVKHAKLHEVLRLRDSANKRIAELEKERESLLRLISYVK